jgi:hypothetical protein
MSGVVNTDKIELCGAERLGVGAWLEKSTSRRLRFEFGARVSGLASAVAAFFSVESLSSHFLRRCLGLNGVNSFEEIGFSPNRLKVFNDWKVGFGLDWPCWAADIITAMGWAYVAVEAGQREFRVPRS